MEKKKSNKLGIWITVLLLIVVFPGVGYIYLQRGLEYHRESYQQLQALGNLPLFEALTRADTTLTSTELVNNTVVLAVLDANPGSSQRSVDKLNRLQDQFDHLDDVLFLALVEDDGFADLERRFAGYGFNDRPQWQLLELSAPELNAVAGDLAKQVNVPRLSPDLFILIDRQGEVRKVYDANDDQEMGRLIEHISYIVPRNKKEKPIMVRQEEL